MELRNINTFLKVAATQNFSKAAEQLGYSQSAVTIQIRQLEKELGISLFERIGKRVYLTERGAEFTSYANEIMRVTSRASLFAKDKKRSERNNPDWRGGICLHSIASGTIAFFSQTISESENGYKIRDNRKIDGDGKK